MATTVLFEDVVSQVSQTAEALGSRVADDISDYAPSIIGSQAINEDEVRLVVPAGHNLWSSELEREIRESVASQCSATGTPCKLIVNMS